MRTYLLITVCLGAFAACEHWVPLDDGGTTTCDINKTPQPDMSTPPNCDAARGLPGDNLICFDFRTLPDQTLTTPPPDPLSKWDFEKFDKGCWQIMGGKLQVKNFAGFMSSCGFLMPATDLNISANKKYNTITLAVVHRVQIDESQQKIQVELGNDDPLRRLVFQTTGSQPRQRTIIEIERADLPAIVAGSFQPLFKLYSGITIGLAGWQIESIAVNASP